MPSGREIGAEVRNAILRYALAKVSKSEAARRLGIAPSTVGRYWPEPPKSRMPKPYKHAPERD